MQRYLVKPRRPDWSHCTGAVQTGDLVLFCTRGARPALARCAMLSGWDHVGMVVRAADGVRTVEVTSEGGVASWMLADRLEEKAVRRVAVRRLVEPLTAAQVAALNHFLGEARGRPYQLHTRSWARRLLCCTGALPAGAGKARGFSCSSFVAEAYAAAGVLPPGRNADAVLPSDLAASFGPAPLHPLQVVAADGLPTAAAPPPPFAPSFPFTPSATLE